MLFFSLGRQNSFIQHNYEVTGQKIKQNIYVAEFDFCVFYSLGSTCNSLLSSITYGDSTVFPRMIPGDDFFFFAPTGGDYSRESIITAYWKSFPTYFDLLSHQIKR